MINNISQKCPPPKAFTLAEVLITLGIIGIVAALTMPSLIAKQKEKAIVTKLKKFYTSFSQAYQMAVNEHGTIDNWGLADTAWTDDKTDFTDEAKKGKEDFMKIVLKYYTEPKYNKNSSTYTLQDGISMSMPSISIKLCEQTRASCGSFRVDLAGNNKAINQSFLFDIYKDKIIPYGAYSNKWYSNDKNMVDSIFRRECGENHVHCTAWVIYNENMDYLHCINDLSWFGAKSCKEAKK